VRLVYLRLGMVVQQVPSGSPRQAEARAKQKPARKQGLWSGSPSRSPHQAEARAKRKPARKQELFHFC
jgi:hypothetical protein